MSILNAMSLRNLTSTELTTEFHKEQRHLEKDNMSASTANAPSGAESVRWNFNVFGYKDESDPQIDTDIAELVTLTKHFDDAHKGKLVTSLAFAIQDYTHIDQLSAKIFCYLMLRNSQDLANEKVKSKQKEAEELFSKADAEHLTFFTHEINRLTDKEIETLAVQYPTVKKHLPMIARIRRHKPFQLAEPIEQSLSLRAPFGAGTWADFYEEEEAKLRFSFEGKEMNLSEILNVLQDTNRDRRRDALKIINDVLGKDFSALASQTLNTLCGASRIDDGERGYKHSMDSRNRSNMLSDGSVDALHEAVTTLGAQFAQRAYILKTKLLGIKGPLGWFDRNAPLPFSSTLTISYEESVAMATEAMLSFSPTMARELQKIIDNGWIDAPTGKSKRSGAFNLSAELPGDKAVSFIMLNFLGKPRDVATLAHEGGHGIHGLLAAAAQGCHMMSAPTAYAETASIFAENVLFYGLLDKLRKEGKEKEMLALICEKIDDITNTVIRQISFSEFEKRVHGAARRLSPEEMCDIWMDVTKKFYGEEGVVFMYENIQWLWAYVSHFHRRFYVYGYACGEMVTQSLYAVRELFGEKFEELYLELLRAGNTKDLVTLLKPFGLDPEQKSFWEKGLTVSLGKLIEEAEHLAKKLGLVT